MNTEAQEFVSDDKMTFYSIPDFLDLERAFTVRQRAFLTYYIMLFGSMHLTLVKSIAITI
jgi:hypothetical protein